MLARFDQRYTYLNLIRGVAALAVFASHLRGFVFNDFSSTLKLSVPYKVFYFVTGFGHTSVVVFFVLSGFLIGKSVIATGLSRQWSWRNYAVKRLSRLWLVLIPALILTATLDFVGRYYFNSAVYDGSLSEQYHSVPSSEVAGSAYSALTFICNLFFLQTIVSPTFGSNGPLWSLSNEFWYYVLFPLFYFGLKSYTALNRRVLFLGLAGALCLWLPLGLLIGGLVWLLGVLVSAVETRVVPGRILRAVWVMFALAIFASSLTLARTNRLSEPSADLFVGISFAILMLPLTQLHRPNEILAKASDFLANISYTLYLVHFPIAALLAAGLMRGKRLPPGLDGATLYAGLFVFILLVAYGIYTLFEKHTGRVQKEILRISARRRPKFPSDLQVAPNSET